MRAVFKAVLASALVAGTSLAGTAPAEARDHTGTALAAGIIGLGIGAAIVSSDHHNRYYSNDSYYSPGYGYNNGYAPAYSYGYGSGYGYDRGSYGRGYYDGRGYDRYDRDSRRDRHWRDHDGYDSDGDGRDRDRDRW